MLCACLGVHRTLGWAWGTVLPQSAWRAEVLSTFLTHIPETALNNAVLYLLFSFTGALACGVYAASFPYQHP